MIKKIYPLLIILILTSCGYVPIYNSPDKSDYKINIIEKSGDRLINNLIVSEIKAISNSQSNAIFNLKVNTVFEKIIVSKNAKGTVSDYQLILRSNFVIKKGDKSETISFVEKQNIKNTSDIFEQKNYENTIKRNFVISLVRKLNLELLTRQ
tara:strand:- start:984 stop:1439 length:456 start_codon:yes stop_codon:yes gene_type:complete